MTTEVGSPLAMTLTQTVRAVAAQHPQEASPAVLAKAVLGRIPPGGERAVLAALLPRYVAEVLRRAEQTPAGAPDAAWQALLSDRVPTEAGYRFLRDCSPQDVRAGATRRRAMAENLTRRADLYEAIAESLDQLDTTEGQDVSPALVPPERAEQIVTQARGYVPPGGGTLGAPSPLKPTVVEVVDELDMLTDEVLVKELTGNPELLEKLVIADARGLASARLSALLASAALAEPWYEAVLRVKANLIAAKQNQAANGVNASRMRHLSQDINALQLRVGAARAALEEHVPALRRRPRLTEEERAARDQQRQERREFIGRHQEEFDAELARRCAAAGLGPERELEQPPQEQQFPWAVQHGLLPHSDAAQQLLDLDDAAFGDLVKADVTGQECPTLRHWGVVDRWIEALKAATEEFQSLGETADPKLQARRRRYHAAVMQRQGEARRLRRTRTAHLTAATRERNRDTDRHQIVRETIAWLEARHR